MRIALDYDDTITKDYWLWHDFAVKAMSRGHEVVVVTMRFPHEEIEDWPGRIIYTCRLAKRKWCQNLHEPDFDVWIDDCPELVDNDL